MIYDHNPFNLLTHHAVNTCYFDENAVLQKRVQVAKLFVKAGMEVVMHEYHIFFSAFLKLLLPIEKYLAWLPLRAQHFVVGKKP